MTTTDSATPAPQRFRRSRAALRDAGIGVALLVVSSEIPELMRLCDRILVLSRGRLAGTVERADFAEAHILALAYSGYMETAS